MFSRRNNLARAIVTAGALAFTVAAHAQRDQKPPQAAPESSQDITAAPGPTPAPTNVPATNTTAIRANNIGIALMDRQQFGEALGRFQTACVMDLNSDAGCLNMGIALL